MMKIAPSILAANFANLEREIRRIPDADWLHIDVMDGIFVPNMTVGPPVIRAIRKVTKLPLDVHLMIDRPIRYIKDYLAAGSNLITVHVESDTPENITAAIRAIQDGGAKAGLSLKPGTPLEALKPWLRDIDLLVVMTVEPGFSGQKFMHDQVSKLRRAATLRQKGSGHYKISVDGGISSSTVAAAAAAGADVFVAGNAVFASEDPNGSIRLLSRRAEEAAQRAKEDEGR